MVEELIEILESQLLMKLAIIFNLIMPKWILGLILEFNIIFIGDLPVIIDANLTVLEQDLIVYIA